jgi:uncharacterized iron-regulated protein
MRTPRQERVTLGLRFDWVANCRRVQRVAVAAMTCGLTACVSSGAAATVNSLPGPANPAQRVVASASGQTISYAQLADRVSPGDVVFFGEQHDDDESHRAELALLESIGARHAKVVLSLEMFERDVQSLVDAYLTGSLTEEAFRAQSRPWPNYAADYRPLVELAKAKGWPVVAANVPRRLASIVSRKGLIAVDSLSAADRAFVAADLQCPKDTYYDNFVAVMGGMHGGAGGAGTGTGTAPTTGARPMVDLFYESQCVKDETMAESIVQARTRAGRSAVVVHFNGAFHSDFGLGTVSRVARRAGDAKTIVVSAVPAPDPSKAKAAGFLDRGQFIILARRIKP